MKESKEDRFRRVAEARVNKIIKMVRLLGNCSGENVYRYTADQAEQIFTALQIELDLARKRFFSFEKNARKRFSLSDTAEPKPGMLSHPHISLTIPNVAKLMAVAFDDESYPAINLYLLAEGENEDNAQLLCFAEYNSEKEPNLAVCIAAYQSHQDDTTYYEPYYAAERNTDNESDIESAVL